MSAKHPVIAVTGSSGAGTTTVRRSFEHLFNHERVKAAFVEGDSFHRYDRQGMNEAIVAAEQEGRRPPSHFGSEANLFEELEAFFRQYCGDGTGKARRHLHN